MGPKEYMVTQLKLVTLAKQVNALGDLREYVLYTQYVVENLNKASPQTPEIVDTVLGTGLLRDVAEAMIAVQQRVQILDRHFHTSMKKLTVPGPTE